MFMYFNFSRSSTRLAVFAGILGVLAVILHRLHIIGFQIALPGLAVSAFLGLLAAFLGIVGLFIAMRQRKSAMSSLIGALLGFIVATPTLFTILAGSGVPRIHDISTDLDNPPAFEAVLSLRAPTDNTLDRQWPENLAQLQRTGYPDLQALQLEHSKVDVFKQALELVKLRDWNIAAADAEKGIIEATATTPIMGFKDDVVIRIQNTGEKTQVDMRSVSRVGLSDLGANAARIQHFLNDLQIIFEDH